MGFKSETTAQDVVKTPNLAKLSKDKFMILTKATMCDLLVHYIKESEDTHDNLVGKINSRVSVTFDSKLNTISQIFDAKVQKLEQKFENEIQNLTSKIPTNFAEPTVPEPEQAPTNYSLLVTKPSDDDEDRSWADIVSDLDVKLENVPVKKSKLTKDGEGYYVAFNNEEARDKAKVIIEGSALETTPDTKVSTKIAPKLKLLDLDYARYSEKATGKDKLRKAILAKNSDISDMVHNKGMCLDIIFIKEEEGGYGSAVIKVDPRIRSYIVANKRKICVDMSEVHAKDQIHLTQCFSCQNYGHKRGSDHCKYKDDKEKNVCLYCASEHPSKDCPVKRDQKKHKCYNCFSSPVSSTRKNATGHTSTSLDCPIRQREVQSLVSRTAGLDPKNFIYQRTMPQIRQHWTIST